MRKFDQREGPLNGDSSRRRAWRRALCAAALAAIVVVAACADTTPRPAILSIDPASVALGAPQLVHLTTEGCAPTFDLDRGTIAPDRAIVLWLGDTSVAVARRTGVESFEATLPPQSTPGTYALTLDLGDGRRASSAQRLVVGNSDAGVDAGCGAQGTACCASAPRCATWSDCVAAVCAPCGGYHQPACRTGSPCRPGLSVPGGSGMCN